MRILKTSLPLIFLAAVFSFNECQRLEASSALDADCGALPQLTALMLRSKSANMRRAAHHQIAEQQMAAQQLAERNAGNAFSE